MSLSVIDADGHGIEDKSIVDSIEEPWRNSHGPDPEHQPSEYGLLDRVFAGCEGGETGLACQIQRAGNGRFLFASDFPHETGPGDTVVVVGCGGLGSAAVQTARIAGAANVVAVDPAEMKRKQALGFGATHTAESMEAAMETVGRVTHGVMADSVILTPGVMEGHLLAPAQFLVRKGGTVVVTAVAPLEQMDVQFNLFEFAMMDKQLRGTVFGSRSPRSEIPHLLSLYSAGLFDIDSMVTAVYTLEELNDGYQDMRDNKNIRGVVVFD